MDAALKRLLHPCWCPDPDNWVWTRPDGAGQGLFPWREDTGLINLVWLMLDMDKPPETYDLRDNALIAKLIVGGGRCATLSGMPLYDVAALSTLLQFRAAIQWPSATNTSRLVFELIPDLTQLIDRRLAHAHT